uniref:TNF receptor superfamily member 6b n=2 Tax=Pelodiscus sinensis TaxID=13735 RepID=K7G7N2_PELSI|nr:tumor necrosis factor receptor superfamily member 6B [Pelodiscus sinensis]XP_006132516.1 tumor necrosis factor receptor superfamily member 6B [Pelodiscus sinensis]XP_025045153.1 tumor necrosis factor receptor superfamily member 6B [Pelodiscus sinensis]XP_025045154.1 tumor necrosis factor receptor superfamily member 6B [Pelodiscus sinensis]|eukprot:XP_006132515.1 tumor necrosis factor receptor superfamily member 6B [Pelodiscus sinensis]
MNSNINNTLSAVLSSRTQNMRHSSQWMVAAIVLFLAVPSSSTTPTYPWKDPITHDKLLCHQCPPGTFVAQHCTRDKPTVCARCPDLHYTQYWNYLEKCRYCNVICGELQVELHQCNSTHNRVCQCREGYYSDSEFCIEHAKCPAGFGVVQPGTPHRNTRCEMCPPGFFSSSSSTEPCRAHQSCSQQGKETNVEGNQFHDALCTTCKMFKGNSTQEPGNADCNQAVIDFVVYQNIPVKKLKRLQQIFERRSKEHQHKDSQAALQEKFHTYLTHLKKDHLELVKVLLNALRVAKLHSVEEKVRRRFSLPLEN